MHSQWDCPQQHDQLLPSFTNAKGSWISNTSKKNIFSQLTPFLRTEFSKYQLIPSSPSISTCIEDIKWKQNCKNNQIRLTPKTVLFEKIIYSLGKTNKKTSLPKNHLPFMFNITIPGTLYQFYLWQILKFHKWPSNTYKWLTTIIECLRLFKVASQMSTNTIVIAENANK